MQKEKHILVSTTSSLTGIEIKQYLKPVSAHVVAGTDFFSDLTASFSDFFGGRSKTYQNQLTSIYNEAIEQLKEAAIKIGANGIIGLHVDLDEISGKSKSMFMVTAIGTAIVIDNKKSDPGLLISSNIDLEALETLRRKKEILQDIKSNGLALSDENWEFIKTNQIPEVFDYLVDKYKAEYVKNDISEVTERLYRLIPPYLEVFSDDVKSRLLYTRILTEQNESITKKLCKIIETFNLFDFDYINKVLDSKNFDLRKVSTTLIVCEKSLYNKEDIKEIAKLIERVKESFPETGSYSTKKGFLSSKEKEVWTCSCGRTNNEIGDTCDSCHKDINGFTKHETPPGDAIHILEERQSLIAELLS